MSVTIKSYRREREREIIDGLQKALEKVGQLVENDAGKNIINHSSSTPWKDTGQLARAVTHIVSEGAVEIGIKQGEQSKGKSLAKIGKWLELGHSQHPGQFVKDVGARLVASSVPPYPWLFPALESNRQKIIDLLKKSGAKGISID